MTRSHIKDLSPQALTLEEKATLLCGFATMNTAPIERLSIPSLRFSDGPHGVRAELSEADSLGGIANSMPSTCFPAATTTANSWNIDNLYAMGKAIGEECRHFGIHVLLGPAVNLKRNPLAGRNFEYFSEDPLLTGELGAALSNGIQETGVGVSVKHFAANNAETFRFTADSVIDERALRELYLRGFETIVKKARPASVMCAYNKLNGVYCSQNRTLLTDILRTEWGFDGAVMTDWGAVVERDKGIATGLDLEMPGMVSENVQAIIRAVNDKTLSEAALDAAVGNLLTLIERVYTPIKAPCDFTQHAALAAEIAADSAVLLKNNNGCLPLQRNKRYLAVGDLFQTMRYQGSGSSLVRPHTLCTPKQAFEQAGVSFAFARGYREDRQAADPRELQEAVAKAATADVLLVFAGQTDAAESEGFDRETMSLPPCQLALIDALSALHKPMVLILFGGSSIELPFEAEFDAILHMYLPGQQGGNAVYALLFGEKTPSGKLAETWVMQYGDVPFANAFAKTPIECYKESVYVGYRYYLSADKPVRYPFGYGLSYTSFAYSDLTLTREQTDWVATLTVRNTGAFDGSEIVQLYVSAPKSDVFKPTRELRGFAKVYIPAGECRKVTIRFSQADLRYYHPPRREWILEPGDYRVLVGASSTDIRLQATFSVAGDAVPSPYSAAIRAAYSDASVLHTVSDATFAALIGRDLPVYRAAVRPFTMETPICEFHGLCGTFIKKVILAVGVEQYKKASRHIGNDQTDKERKQKAATFVSKMILSNCLRSLCFSSGGKLPLSVTEGMLDIANGHPLRGVCRMAKRDRKNRANLP